MSSKEFEFAEWYDYLKDFTFESTTLPVSEPEGKAMLNRYEEVYKHGKGRFTEEDKEQLIILEEKLENVIQEYIKSNNCDGVFVKFSLRSPKDSTLASERMRNHLEWELDNFGDLDNDEGKPEISGPDRMISYIRAQSRSLKVNNAKDALATFFSSKRIYTDLMLAFLEDSFELDIILRKWSDDFVIELEFRGFVFNGEFTALTQYYNLLYIPFVAKNHKLIEEKIVSFWKTNMKDIIPMKNYTIDFGLEYKNNEYEVVVIELNPPAPLAGTSLFDAIRDKNIIENGPFEFRYVSEPIDDAESHIYGPLRQLMNEKFPKFAEEYKKKQIEEQAKNELEVDNIPNNGQWYSNTLNLLWSRCDII